MDSPQEQPLAQALNKLWQQHLPQMSERVAVMESANAALAAGRLTAQLQSEANSAAHKLAGVLGTFGFHDGTDLAREAEACYSAMAAVGPQAAARLGQIAAELRAIVEGRDRGQQLHFKL